MKSLKILKTALVSLISIFMLTSIAGAAMFTASIDDVGTEELAAFTIWLDVANDFDVLGVSTMGDAVPGSWVTDANNGTIGNEGPRRVAKFGSSDFLAVLGSPLTPLAAGDLVSFEYTGTINGLFLSKFGTIDEPDIFGERIFLSSFDETGATFSAVPIPSALLLLGGGLVGLVGIRRKTMK